MVENMDNIEVYIPKGACVKTIPFKSLSTSMARKISVHLPQKRSETSEKQPVTYISPVELREKAASSEMVALDQRSSMTKITPGQCWLPVVSSSVEAYKVLKTILTAHKPRIQLSGPENEADSRASSLQKNSFIVFNNQIFLFVKKSRGKRVRSQNSALPSQSASTVPTSQQKQQNSPRSCQTQSIEDSLPRPQQRLDPSLTRESPGINVQTSSLLQKDTAEQRWTSSECQKAAGTTSSSATSPPKPPEDPELIQKDLQTSNSKPHQSQSTTHTSAEVPEEPKTAGGGGETDENLETAGFLPKVESCLTFDFQLLAKEEKISNLRARLRQKEAALSVLKSRDDIMDG
ncbi:uncharacterized protein [Paramisgurnus dabryanus]|uniref:uncharacterized protein n=1 Tax=Paramisgurnus dabryanus TaxID=90735 RepID=UPI0031F4542A